MFFPNFTFGCAHTALGEPIGVAGFGPGLLSLPAQISTVSPQLGNRFSYCLVSHSFNQYRVHRPTPLILGRYDDKERKDNSSIDGSNSAEFVYTSMLDNPSHPYFYSFGLKGIPMGKRNITALDILKRLDWSGNGGTVVDSGTTFTMLPMSPYNSVEAKFDRLVGRVHERASEVVDKVVNVPAMDLHFVGNRAIKLPSPN